MLFACKLNAFKYTCPDPILLVPSDLIHNQSELGFTRVTRQVRESVLERETAPAKL